MFKGKHAEMELDEDDSLPILDLARTEGFEVFAERVDQGDEVAQRLLDEWGVDDLYTEKGYQAWFGKVHGVGEATTPGELLVALDSVPYKDDGIVWTALARLLGFPPGTASAEKILAGTVVKHVMDADEGVRDEIEEFFGAIGEDLDVYDLELARQGGTAILGDPATDEPEVARGRLNDKIRLATAARLKDIKDGMVAGVRVNTAEQRSLDRLAWVLANLKSSRECVAVVTLLEDEIRLFANAADAQLAGDFKRLFDAAAKGRQAASADISALFDEMVAQKLEVRVLKQGKVPDDILRRGERRLRKTLDYLASLEKSWDDLRVMTHRAANGMKIHAETQAGDVLLRQRAAALGEEAGWSDDEDLEKREAALRDKIDDGKRARLTRRVTDAKIAIGISKLCCFKCWLMIRALRAKDISIAPSGTHLKTYPAGWPAPASLTRPSLLRAFLQIPDDPKKRTDADEYLLNAMSTTDGRAAIISEIVRYSDKGQMESGYESSEDEGEGGLTLWQNYYGDGGGVVQPAPVRKPVKKAVRKPVQKAETTPTPKQLVRTPTPRKVVEREPAPRVDDAEPRPPTRVTRSSGLRLPEVKDVGDPPVVRFVKRKANNQATPKSDPKKRNTRKKST
ncbi:hypothetical protein FDA94_10160 [Herbidospora galbida]|uniref:Uncharacterized protein n=1 Tax=Herbidospora galbida TaxID=2575442 RepID=A0A4U3MIH2_9ACTN|nr:hypothetical protein [Herbidospora galbida]TKK89288.1 hypothetical protein FDA94_10160 [Herbidospora galbida]